MSDQPKRTIEEILIEMKQHAELNPGHGFNCSCKDSHVNEIRRIISDLELKKEFRLVAIYSLNWYP